MKRISALTTVLILLVFYGCDQPTVDHFTEYRGTNLSPSLSSWNSAVDAEYLSYSQVSTDSGNGGTETFRLETMNLFPNGDFEESDISLWNEYHYTTEVAPVFNLSTGKEAISGQSLYYRISRQTQVVYFDLSRLADSLKGERYQIHFILNSGSNTNKCNFFVDSQYLEKPDLYWEIATETETAYTDLFLFPGSSYTGDFSTPADSSTLYFGLGDPTSSEEQQGSIDNMEIIRTDQQNIISVFMPLENTGRPDLLDGTYRFTLYVKGESSTSLSPNIKNRFASKGIHLSQWVEVYSSDAWNRYNISGFEQINYVSSIYNESGWTAVTLDFSVQFSQLYENRLRINISPTLLSSENTDRSQELAGGSILISSPHLEFFPEGL